MITPSTSQFLVLSWLLVLFSILDFLFSLFDFRVFWPWAGIESLTESDEDIAFEESSSEDDVVNIQFPMSDPEDAFVRMCAYEHVRTCTRVNMYTSGGIW